jgi:TRAP-type C4-dicarboxylate transport system permease small subunit
MWWFSRWITLPLGVVGGIVVFALMVLTVIDVVMRKLAGQGVPGVIEYSEVLLVVGVFFAIAAAQVRGFHVATTGFVSALPRTARRIVELVGAALGVLVIATMAYVAVITAWTSFETGEYRMGIAHVLVWPARAAVAVGFILYLVEFIHGAVLHFQRPEDEPDTELELAERGVLL